MSLIPVYLLLVTSITLEAFFIQKSKLKIHPATINNKVFTSEYSDKKKCSKGLGQRSCASQDLGNLRMPGRRLAAS